MFPSLTFSSLLSIHLAMSLHNCLRPGTPNNPIDLLTVLQWMYPVGLDLRPGKASTNFRNAHGIREGRGGHSGANFVCDLPSIFLSTCDRFPLSHPTSASAMGRFRFSWRLQNPRSSSDRICPNNPSNFYTNHLNYFFTMKTVRNVGVRH